MKTSSIPSQQQIDLETDIQSLLKYLIDKHYDGYFSIPLNELPYGQIHLTAGYGYDENRVRRRIFIVTDPEKNASTIAKEQGNFPKN